MKSVKDVFDAVGGPKKLADAIGVKTSTVNMMKTRGSIPVEHWDGVLAAIPASFKMNFCKLARLLTDCEIARKSNDTP